MPPTPRGVRSSSGPERTPAFALLSVATALVTITLTLVAWRLTGTVGLLSDAIESFVDLVAALVAALPGVSVINHLEPLEDPASWDDAGLERKAKG